MNEVGLTVADVTWFYLTNHRLLTGQELELLPVDLARGSEPHLFQHRPANTLVHSLKDFLYWE
jgi:hypothetical protein